MRKLITQILKEITQIFILVVIINGCAQKPLYKEARFLMGTIIEVTSNNKQASSIVFDEIARIDNLLSKYKEYSEISQLNKLGNLKVSPETMFIIKKAKEFWQITDGAFDITVAPLLDLWGFTHQEYKLPKESEIKKTLKLVGLNKIIIDEKNNIIKFKQKGMKIDLGAIAKGYAVDAAVNKLRQAGIKSALINAGGQIYCLGDKDGKPWKVAIRNPRRGGFVDYLELKDKAVSTSGDYEQYFKVGEKRFSHIFNPKTGKPSESGVVSVTVIADDGLTADAISTSIFVLGKQNGEALARDLGLKVIILTKDDVSDN